MRNLRKHKSLLALHHIRNILSRCSLWAFRITVARSRSVSSLRSQHLFSTINWNNWISRRQSTSPTIQINCTLIHLIRTLLEILFPLKRKNKGWEGLMWAHLVRARPIRGTGTARTMGLHTQEYRILWCIVHGCIRLIWGSRVTFRSLLIIVLRRILILQN